MSEVQERALDPRNLAAGTLIETEKGEVFCIARQENPETGAYLVNEKTAITTHWKASNYLAAKWRPSKLSPEKYYPKILGWVGNNHPSLGCDPEIFARDSRGKIIPAWKWLPSKNSLAGANGLYWDGFQAEFRTLEAPTCLERLTDNYTRNQLQKVRQELLKHDKNAKLVADSVVEVPEDELMCAKQEHIQLGCAPSNNVYGNHSVKIPDSRKLKYRFAGGHMHFGISERLKWTKFPQEEIDGAVKMMDAMVGVAMVSFAADYDSPIRRKYYGQAGEFRLPKHGLEYRVLSNFWLCHPSLQHLAFDIARYAMNLGLCGMRCLVKTSDSAVERCINDTDVDTARAIMLRNKPLWDKVLGDIYARWGAKIPGITWEALLNGPKVVKIDPRKIAENWELDLSFSAYRTRCDGRFFVPRWSQVCK